MVFGITRAIGNASERSSRELNVAGNRFSFLAWPAPCGDWNWDHHREQTAKIDKIPGVKSCRVLDHGHRAASKRFRFSKQSRGGGKQ